MKYSKWIVALGMLWSMMLWALRSVAETNTEGKNITSNICTNFSFDDIHVSGFSGQMQMPEVDMRITQGYNTTQAEGFIYEGKLYYGHDGIDIHELGAPSGQNSIFAVESGLVVVSQHNTKAGGWGDSVIIATRPSWYSEEIITTHYHHLHYLENNNIYTPTRRFNACETVYKGEILAKEGGSGQWPTHLHFGVRRWENIAALKKALTTGGKAIYGSGYTFGDNSKIAKHLHPFSILFHSFLDYQYDSGQEPSYAWSLPYITTMEEQGIEFGRFNGNYGAGENVSRADLTRWLKIAAEQFTVPLSPPTFDDVGTASIAFPYIETMTRYPEELPVVNPDNSCKAPGHNFCPDDTVKRAEALKMVIMTFYGQEYLTYYQEIFWSGNPTGFVNSLSTFQDVSILDWYAPFVAFGVGKNIVTMQSYFHPDNKVKREEAAKWIIKGLEYTKNLQGSWCSNHSCGNGYFCKEILQQCTEIQMCLADENTMCPVGGGFNPCNQAECEPGSSIQTDCNNNQGIMNKECTAQCSWGQWSSCMEKGPCSPGTIMDISCNNGNGMQESVCGPDGQWGQLSTCSIMEVWCNPGDLVYELCNGGTGTHSHLCNASSHWDPWSDCIPNQPQCECINGLCCDGCHYLQAGQVCHSETIYKCEGANPGQDPQQLEMLTYCSGNSPDCNGPMGNEGWQSISDCSLNEQCQILNGIPQCVAVGANCQDTFTPSDTEKCCGNPDGIGNPTLCLQLQQSSGANWQYRVCKQGNSFQNNFTFQLEDDNHQVFFNTYNGTAGTTCTPWKNFNLGYVTQDGAVNGAGLRAAIISPAGCNQSGCMYWSGEITVSKSCE